MNEEIWKDVRGYESKYAVSNMGRVKSLNYNNTGKEKLLRPCKHRDGYLHIYLCKGGKRKTHRVHRLVLMTFNPCENSHELQVNHINELKDDNRLENLEWVTCKENCNHGTRNKRVAEKRRGKFNTKKSIPIVQLTLDGKFVKAWKSSKEAARGGFNQGNIIQCCKNKFNREGNNIYKGYRFMYLSEYMDKYNGIID